MSKWAVYYCSNLQLDMGNRGWIPLVDEDNACLNLPFFFLLYYALEI